nr:hypothetical protein [Acanthopleuribacter pedis]
MPVRFSDAVARQLADPNRFPEDFQALIIDVLAADPRPAYRRKQGSRVYGVKLYQYDVKWRVEHDGAEVFQIVSC